jgi:hypothetical protein
VPADKVLSAEELDALLAPIALYPDTLLALVLMASTYPLEVVEADRWLNENKALKGDQLKAAAEQKSWDESVKSLTATPPALTMMSTKLDWTRKLGDAVLAQQPDVMDAVQRLRSKAQANKKLESTKEQKVTVKQEANNKQVIVIEPTQPGTVYVPSYNPSVVYGAWPYPSYPPYYFPPPGYVAGGLLATGLAFGAGYALGRWASGGNYWGGGVNWNNNNINVNRSVNINNSGNNWQHNAQHRQGVKYNNSRVQQQFGNNNLRQGSQNRMDFRGRGGNQVLSPGPGGGNRAGLGPGGAGGPGAGNRPGSGAGPGGGARPGGGDRPGAAQRPAGGQRPGGGAQRPGGGGGRDSAFGNMQSGRAANAQSQRGQASLGNRGGGGGGGISRGGGGGMRAGGGGGGMRGGGGGGARGGGGGGGRGGGGGGGRRSDIAAKHDIVLLGRLDNGLGFYRFRYNGSDRAYVGVMAQEVQSVLPSAVARDRDGYLTVSYDKLGVKFQTYDRWVASGARIPPVRVSH